jgi:phosphate transport system substrate-binding protein
MGKKKIIINVVTVIICLLILAGGFFAYRYFTTEKEEILIDKEISSEPIFTAENYPKVDGSTATVPLAEAFQANFTGQSKDDVEVTHSKTHQAYENLINKDLDLILVTEPSEEELQMAKDAGVELEVTKVVNEGFVFFLNKYNPVNSLTLEQIQGIYSGEITNWKEVGGTDQEIIAYQRPTNSGSQTGMLSLVMKDKKIAEAPKETIADSMFDIIDVVSNYENGANSIGYSYYYYANTMYLSDDIKLLSVNGVEPNNETIGSGEYPILTAYYIVNRKDDISEDAKTLKENMLSARGQKVAEEAGYVPIQK